MEDHLPYCLYVSYETPVAYPSLYNLLTQSPFVWKGSDPLDEQITFEFFRTPEEEVRITLECIDGTVISTSISMKINIKRALLEAVFYFLSELEKYDPVIRDQEVKNELFLKGLEQHGDKFILLSGRHRANDITSFITSDLQQFVLNPLGIGKRKQLLANL